MISKTQLSSLIAFAVAVWAGYSFLWGPPLTWESFAPYGTVQAAVALAVFAFESKLWKWRVLRPWLADTPDISGTWEVRLVSDYVDPSTNTRVPPKMCYMRIYQTYSRLSMRLMTDESASEVIVASVIKSTDDGFQAVGVYRNEPKVLLMGRSPIHYGGIVLSIQGTPPSKLEGHYWTGRKTTGELYLSRRNPKLYDDFLSANNAFSSNRWSVS